VDDIFQDVLLAIWTGLEKFRHESGYGTWIYRITVNTIFLFNRKERKRKLPIAPEISTSSSIHDFEMRIREEENLRIMHAAISRLPEIDRMLVALYLEKLSYAEIGAVLGISTNLVGVRLNRVRERIRKQINQ
jgi:RNA polymerase sigma-70 factor (ECF subfamily)